MALGAPTSGASVPTPAISQVVLTASITASTTQATLAARQTTITPSGGSAYTYAGALTAPTGSSASLDATNTANPTFTPDKAGVYVVTLAATDTASGASVTEVSTLEVRTASPLSVSIAAISDQTAVTGTISCDSTVSNAIGAVTYAWSGEGPDGVAPSFSDATAPDPTITLSATTVPGNYTVRVTVMDAARAETVSAVTYFRVGGDVTEGVRAIEFRVVGGALVAQEVALVGDVWVKIGAAVTPTVETDGGLTYSDTTMTIPAGIGARSTGAHTCTHEAYVAFTSFSATFQAMLADSYVYTVKTEETSMETTANARWGVAITTAAGSFDAGTENLQAVLTGHNGTNWSNDTAFANNSWTERSTGASLGRRLMTSQIGNSTVLYCMFHGGAAAATTNAGGAVSAPTRLYLIACSKTTPTITKADVVDPIGRFEVRAAAL